MRVLNLTCFLNYKMKQKKEKKNTQIFTESGNSVHGTQGTCLGKRDLYHKK